MSQRRISIFKATVVSALATGISRVLGAARDIAIGHVFGAGKATDAFWIAYTIPSVFRRFVADEGLTGALIPAVAQAEHQQGEESARRLAGGSLAALLIAGLIICVLGMLAAPYLVWLFAYGFTRDPEQFSLAVTLTRWMFPFVLFVALVSYCEGLLNLRGHFFVPKLAPGIVAGCIAAAALLLAGGMTEPLYALVVGLLAGGLAHLLVCLPPLVIRWGVPVPRLRYMRGERFRRFLKEMGKVVGIGLLAQFNIVVLRLLATLLEEGSVTHYWYAARLVDLAQGAIAVGVGSALLPVIAQDFAEKNSEQFRRHFAEAVRLAFLVLLPVACLLLVLARPIVSVLFLHGRFEVSDAASTAATLQMLVPFMLALAGINIVKKVYYAVDDRTTLLMVGICGVVATALLGYLFSRQLGVQGLGLALSAATVLQLLIYLAVLRHRLGDRIGLGKLAKPLLKLLAASTPAAGLAWLLCRQGAWELGPAAAGNWLWLGAAGLSAMVVYLLLARLLGVAEIKALLARIFHPTRCQTKSSDEQLDE